MMDDSDQLARSYLCQTKRKSRGVTLVVRGGKTPWSEVYPACFTLLTNTVDHINACVCVRVHVPECVPMYNLLFHFFFK